MKTSEINTTARPAKPLHRGRGWGGSSYFSIPELCASATALREGIDNRPSKCAYHLLHVLVDQLLDPIREAWGEPIVVSSGYRCKQLNTLIGGVKNSHHMLGCAADIIGGLSLSPSRRGGTSSAVPESPLLGRGRGEANLSLSLSLHREDAARGAHQVYPTHP